MKRRKAAVLYATNRKKNLLGCVLTTTIKLAGLEGCCAQTAIVDSGYCRTTQRCCVKQRRMLKSKRPSWLVRRKRKAEATVAEKWIQKAISKPGSLRKSLGVKEGKTIPAGKLAKAAKAPGKLGQRARLAQTLKGFKK